jgi:hypothetical protein
MRTVGALFLGVAIATAPALTWAQHSGGGGGGGGGGHASGGGGGHFSGGGHAFGGGGSHLGGFSGGFGGHYSGAHTFAAPHYGVTGHYGGRYFAPTGHGFAYTGATGAHYVAPHSGFVARTGAVAPHLPGPGTHPPGAPGAPGYWHGGHPWYGGYWNGVYWPHAWYYPGWAWYLPVLPLGYATFWWGGVPYYYWNSLYYTWSPSDNGYIVTDPPPTAGSEGSADASGAYEQAPQSNYGGSAGDVYVYPRNGQTPEQTENDRYECHSWASSQSGFDPTRPEQSGGNPANYRNAMVACLDARGYSAR